ncbi:translocation/assembly module TamB domain-containing protein [Amphritea sp. 1_MG-2023]|uniref:translocation/assembly module TamB domain-containing protein n=1 Tax=Amphritea sp. 1_MG-2023 TaxID=3062670 RepID=UPI0026E3C597|nr:translocation/assembly module TamB domain-containing protein [Amphritea sp. 1_MG-2023]MDO6562546.1 translocation/assembly module TamB domain-containing protein [Amphritea sp. 1_MG-2023]
MTAETHHTAAAPRSYLRWVKYFFSLLAVSCVLLLAMSAYLLGTTSGLRQLLTMSQHHLAGQLEVKQINGSLFDRLELTGVDYTEPNMTLSVNRVQWDWQPTALLSGHLQIIQLSIDQPVITLTHQAKSDSPAEAVILPDISLPLSLQIEQLQVQQLRLKQVTQGGQASSATVIDNIQLRLHSEAQTLILEQLAITAAPAHIAIDGQLTPSGQFPLQLNTQWTIKLPEKPSLSGQGVIQGTLQGDRHELTIQQTLSGLISTSLSAAVHNLFETPQGQIKLDDFSTDLAPFSTALSDRQLSGSAHLEGNIDTAQMQSRWQTSLPDIGDTALTMKLRLSGSQLNIEQLNITQLAPPKADKESTQKPLAIKVHGDINLSTSPLSFHINGQWNNLRYPLTSEAEYLSPAGQLEIKGDVQHYRVMLNSALSGPRLPAGHWQLSATGSEQALTEVVLTGDTLDGAVKLTGQLAWQPYLSWQFNLDAQQLNPAQHWSAWPGRLDIAASVEGRKAVDQPLQLQLQLTSLTGTLRQQPIFGQGNINLNGTRIAIPQLRLNIATTELETQGYLDEAYALRWAILSPDLHHLHPELKGSLTATGSLTGTRAQPHVIAKLEGQTLQFNQHQSATLSADIDIDLNRANRSSLQLSATHLILADQSWQQLSLNGQGKVTQHQLSLKAEQGPIDIALNLNGGWQAAQWRGDISRLDLRQADLDEWQIQQPTGLQLSQHSFALDQLCLQSRRQVTSALCLKGNGSTLNGIAGALTTQQLSLTLLQPWMPTQAVLKGNLEADIRFSQAPHKAPIVTGYARLNGTELSLAEEDLQIVAGTITLDIEAQNNQLKSTLSLPLQQPAGQLTAHINMTDLNASQQLNSEIDLALNDLKFVSLFTPQLQAISGQIHSAVSITGRVTQPIVEGHLTLSQASTDLPALGIKLEDINLSVKGKPGNHNLQLKGQFQSGGAIQVNGQYNPLRDSGQISFQGEHFKAIATEEIQAWISPAMTLAIAPTKITVRGELNIPEATIKPPKLDASAALSDDVVIIDPHIETQPLASDNRLLDAQLRITLGDKVYLDALGFKGRLLGSVLIEDNGRQVTRATGIMQVASGQYRLYGQDLDIDRGSLIYSGGPIDNPGLDLRVARTIDKVTAGAKVSGTLSDPQLALYSDPSMPESSQLSYLIFGRAPGASGSSFTEQELLFKAASALTLKGSNSIAEQLSETFNIDDLGVTGDSASETSLYIGKYLSPRLYVKYGVGLLEPTHTFFMRYRLNQAWSVETQTASEHNGGDIFYTLER